MRCLASWQGEPRAATPWLSLSAAPPWAGTGAWLQSYAAERVIILAQVTELQRPTPTEHAGRQTRLGAAVSVCPAVSPSPSAAFLLPAAPAPTRPVPAVPAVPSGRAGLGAGCLPLQLRAAAVAQCARSMPGRSVARCTCPHGSFRKEVDVICPHFMGDEAKG